MTICRWLSSGKRSSTVPLEHENPLCRRDLRRTQHVGVWLWVHCLQARGDCIQVLTVLFQQGRNQLAGTHHLRCQSCTCRIGPSLLGKQIKQQNYGVWEGENIKLPGFTSRCMIFNLSTRDSGSHRQRFFTYGHEPEQQTAPACF